MNKLEELKSKLIESEKEYKKFMKDNKKIFDIKKKLKKKIEDLSIKYSEEMEKIKPKFPVESLNLGSFSEFFEDESKVTQKNIEKYIEELQEDEDLDEEEIQNLKKLVGWEVDYYSEGYKAFNDGDYYDYGITLTSPEGFTYQYHDQTCMAGNPEFDDAILE